MPDHLNEAALRAENARLRRQNAALATQLAAALRRVGALSVGASGEGGEPEDLTRLARTLRDHDAPWEVRAAAAEALGLLGDPQAARPLARALADSNAAISYAAEMALRRLGAAAVPALIATSRANLWETRWRAISALAAVRDPRAVEPLVAALADPSAQVTRSAVAAIGLYAAVGLMPTERAIALLRAALRHDDGDVRYSAASALGELCAQ